MRWIILTIVTLGLPIGCADSQDESERNESVFDPLTEAVDRAEAVQQTVTDQAEELRRRIEEAEGGRD